MYKIGSVAATALASLTWCWVSIAGAAPFPGCQGGTLKGCPGTGNTTEKFITQPIE